MTPNGPFYRIQLEPNKNGFILTIHYNEEDEPDVYAFKTMRIALREMRKLFVESK